MRPYRRAKMTIENRRVTAEDRERDAVLKQMSEDGYTLVSVNDEGDRFYQEGRQMHFWSLYFTRVVPGGEK